MKFFYIIIFILFIIPSNLLASNLNDNNLFVAAGTNTFPSFPMSFYGKATLNNVDLPVGTKIQAYNNSVLKGEVIIKEDGVYGYDSPTKSKLVVGEYISGLQFKYLPKNSNTALAGDSLIEYNNDFVSGKSELLNFNFTKNNIQLNKDNSETLITSADVATTTILISQEAENPKVNLSSLISTTTTSSLVVTPSAIDIKTNTSIGTVLVNIAGNSSISSTEVWDGVITAPIITSVALPETSGYTTAVSTAIEIGFVNAKLSFNKAVRILFPDQANKKISYTRDGSTFSEITNICTADNQNAGDNLAVDGDCKIDVGDDLVIWTKHFTKFVTYTKTAITTPTPTPAPSSGGGGGGGVTDTTPPTNTSISINSGVASTTSSAITLTLGATGANQMMISNNSDFSGAEWETYTTSKNWNLIAGEGEKTVYAKFKDSYNNISTAVQDSIILITLEENEEEIILDEDNQFEEDVIALGIESDYRTIQLEKILSEAEYINTGDANTASNKIGLKRNHELEQADYNKYMVLLMKDIFNLDQTNINALTNFIVYGTETTKILGSGERAGVINSYKVAFGKLPTNKTEWEDCFKIANGRWPSETSQEAEGRAKLKFKEVYLRDADMNNQNDNAAVTIITYGLRPDNRNLNSEKNAIEIFKTIFKYNPTSAVDWDTVRAIAYSGAKR
jgi:hypothetical protein